jgi:hypothetical protein
MKSILRLLLTLINNSEAILQYIQQRRELFQNLIGIEDEACIILALLMNNIELKFLEHENNPNDFLTTILKRKDLKSLFQSFDL